MNLLDWIKSILAQAPKQRVWESKTQCGRILQALIDGDEIGGREACELLKSHNGLRRLNQVRAALRRAGIQYVTARYAKQRGGNPFKKTWMFSGDREKARKLLKVCR